MRLSNFVRISLLTLLTLNNTHCHPRIVPASENTSDAPTIDVSVNKMTADILLYVNEHRASIGKAPLQLIDDVSIEATKHSEDMAGKHITFGHEGFETRITNIEKKIGAVSGSAENVAYGHITAKEVVDMWVNSPGHKKNMEGNYTSTGIGLAKANDGTIYFTQIFIRK